MTPLCLRTPDRLTPGDVIVIDDFDPDEVVRVTVGTERALPDHVLVRTRGNCHLVDERTLVAVVSTFVPGSGYLSLVSEDAA